MEAKGAVVMGILAFMMTLIAAGTIRSGSLMMLVAIPLAIALWRYSLKNDIPEDWYNQPGYWTILVFAGGMFLMAVTH